MATKRKMKGHECLNSSEATIRNHVRDGACSPKHREKDTGQSAEGMKKIKKATAWRRDMVASSSVLEQCQPRP